MATLPTLVYALQETGATNNFTRRLGEHNGVKNRGARYTRGKTWTPIFLVKGFPQRRHALQFEKLFHGHRAKRLISVPSKPVNPFGSGSSARRAWHLYWALKKERFSKRETVPTKDLSLVVQWSRTDFYTIATTHLLDWGPATVQHTINKAD